MKTILWFGFVLVGIAAGKVFFTKAGHKVTLECGISSFTKILEWSYKNGMIVSVDGKSGFHRKGTNEIGKKSKVKLETNLEISTVAEGDTGKFTCRADGVLQEHMLVVVLVSVSPSSVLQVGDKATLYCRVTNLNPEPTVKWEKPDGTSYTDYSQAIQLKAVAVSDAGTWHCTLTYNGETFRESLNIKVEVPASTTTPPHDLLNPKDRHNPTGIDHATDHQSNDAVLLLGLSWWVWLAVGVGCLIVIVLMVFVIVLCKRIRERNKKKFEKSTQQPLKPKKYCQCDRQAAAAKPQQGRRREKPSALPLQPC